MHSGCPANDLVTSRSGSSSSDSKLERRRLLLRKIGCQVQELALAVMAKREAQNYS